MRNGHETAKTDQPYADRFEQLFIQGSAAALAGTHHREVPLFDGGRYGLSVALLPTDEDARRLGELACEASEVAGGGHWLTGSAATVHFTVRALEAYREHRSAGDSFVARVGEAVARAAARSRPVRFRLGGVVLTGSGVMLCAHPLDDAPDALAAALAEQLGDDALFERDFDRTIWYAMLLHYAGPLGDARRLVQWVEERRDLDAGEITLGTLDLVRWRYNGQQARYTVLRSEPLR